MRLKICKKTSHSENFAFDFFFKDKGMIYFVDQEFYLDLRKQQDGPDSTPVTTRQLEAMIRLTEVMSM